MGNQHNRRQRPTEEPPLWKPSEKRRSASNISRYMDWLRDRKGLCFETYNELWDWSVNDLEGFWGSVWDYFQVQAHRPYSRVLPERKMPGARWFADAELNYAEHALRRRDDHPAVIFESEVRPRSVVTYRELCREVASVAAGLRRLGVRKGDRVVAYLPNIPETLVAFLATASIGAVWSSCSPEFGTRSVIERFQQIEPTVLLGVDGFKYAGRTHHRIEALANIRRQLPTLEHVVVVPYLCGNPRRDILGRSLLWQDLIGPGGELSFQPVPFDHPLWVLYSSGTTGLPKPIVQGHGGILLEHLKVLSLHLDLTPEDRFFWYTTSGWMMWNLLVSGLLLGSTVLLYDGSPGYPDLRTLWRFAQDTGMTYFGTSAPYIQACMKSGLAPAEEFTLDRLRGVGSTASPLTPEGFRWIYEKVSPDVLLGSFSGGTDLCTGFLGPCPLLPVYAGEIQCRCLGARVEAYGQDGRPLVGEVGELVMTAPFPSMPLYLWNDTGGERYRESYFEKFPGVWRHGDWLEVTHRGSCVLSGRSDSTLNRGGVRMGTSEFYRVVEGLEGVRDSLVVDTGSLGQDGKLWLFVVLQQGHPLDDDLRQRIQQSLREAISPRHVPDEIRAIDQVPRTLNGKKLEVPIKRIFSGVPPHEAVNPDTLADPGALEPFLDLVSSTAARK